jgi:thiol-disulfide isomerase/thioredoxin
VIRVSVFGKQECDACKAAFEKISYFSKKWGRADDTAIHFVDMETPEGLAEGAYRDVYDIPTVILAKGDQEVARWVKQVPVSQEFKKYFSADGIDGQSHDKGIR